MPNGKVTVVLGAGASRDVSYQFHPEVSVPSPLDSDFFDLLQRIKPLTKDQQPVHDLLDMVRDLPHECWRSFERAFYTLHLGAVMELKLRSIAQPSGEDAIDWVVARFTAGLQALLREAHGTRSCLYHRMAFNRMGRNDAVISFNYDLVVERALGDDREPPFGGWLYGLESKPPTARTPDVLKLHGSSNWEVKAKTINVRPATWASLDDKPGYRATSVAGSGESSIVLPFWEKPIEEPPWLELWQRALQHLDHTDHVLVWGYSLPVTDVKAEFLFSLGLAKREIDLCVIDPSEASQERWRRLLPKARYWRYLSWNNFQQHPPQWWLSRPHRWGDDNF